jgi:hypothetical protein
LASILKRAPPRKTNGEVQGGGDDTGARWAGIEGASFHITPAAVLLLILNLLDGLFTLTYLQMDLAEELNPLMRVAYEHSPLSFMASKVAIVSLGLTLLCLHRTHAPERAGHPGRGRPLRRHRRLPPGLPGPF